MSNMSYCRFENTLRDLLDCQEHFDDEDLSPREKLERDQMLEICKEIVEAHEEELEEGN